MNRKVPIWVLFLFVWLAIVTTIAFGWAVGYVHEGGHLIRGTAKNIILAVAKFPTMVDVTIKQLTSPPPLVLKDRYPEISGLRLADKAYADSSYLLLSVYDKTADHAIIKLMRLADQKVMHSWKPDITELMKLRDEGYGLAEESHKGNIVLWHPLLFNDGSVVFNTEDRALMKIDKAGKFLWSLKGIYHHSQELDADGNIWASSVMETNPAFISTFYDEYRDDALAKVSPDGKLLWKKSISEILLQNGYRGLLLGIGPYEKDPLHLNDIQPALSSSPYWEKGDVLVSIRNKSTVFLYRPATNKILWLQTGPWLNQHDANFIDDSRISIFGNNIIRNNNYDFFDGHNEVYIFDFRTGTTTTPYTAFLRSSKVKTMTGGRSEVLPNGDVYVEETDFGRTLRGNSKQVIWEYVERLSPGTTSTVGWNRLIQPGEYRSFTFLDN